MASDRDFLLREKYNGVPTPSFEADCERLREGEPLAYVIGHQPFLGVTVYLDSRPLIPRPETEWWTEACIASIPDGPQKVLDLCAGSGAIGCAVLKHVKEAHVTFSDIHREHIVSIAHTIEANGLDQHRSRLCTGDLFDAVQGEQFDRILINPPYIPSTRSLPKSVAQFEPHDALFAGEDGLAIIKRIVSQLREHLRAHGEAWIECDISNTEEAGRLFREAHFAVETRTDQYNRPRYLVVS